MEALQLLSMGGDVATMGVLGFLIMHHTEIRAIKRDIERLEGKKW
jgi:hypothetical protein